MAFSPIPDLSPKDISRFWSLVNKTDGCWLWKNAPNDSGCAVFSIHCKTYYASRISWVLANGAIPDDLLVCHTCDNKICVNPNHFFLGTYKDNHDDMAKKGRRARFIGSKNSQSKLTEDIVKELRKRHQDGESAHSLAPQFGVAPSVALRAINRDTWSHVN